MTTWKSAKESYAETKRVIEAERQRDEQTLIKYINETLLDSVATAINAGRYTAYVEVPFGISRMTNDEAIAFIKSHIPSDYVVEHAKRVPDTIAEGFGRGYVYISWHSEEFDKP